MTFARRCAIAAARGPLGRMAVGTVGRVAGDHRLAVLTYHRIVSPTGDSRSMAPGLASASTDDLEEQLRAARRRFTVIGEADLLELRHGGHPPRGRTMLMVTFDDAYRDFAELAWPIIRRVGVPVTMFVPSGYPDGHEPFWWDQLAFSIASTAATDLTWDSRSLPLRSDGERLAAYRLIHDELQAMPTAASIELVAELTTALGTGRAPDETLGWEELRQLRADGLTIGAHSHLHHRLDRLDPDALRDDLATCRQVLTERIGTTPRTFAYPAGHHDAAAAKAVEAAGFDVAFTTQRGVTDIRRPDWYRLPRINVGLNTNATLVTLQPLVLRAHRPPPTGPT